METEAQEQPVQIDSPTVLSTEPLKVQEDKAALVQLLSEARNTKAVLDGFIGAVRGGRYDGGMMLDLAKGLAFLDAIRNQNIAHIKNLQERTDK